MYLQETPNVPSYNVSQLWQSISFHIGELVNKNKAYEKKFKHNNALITVTNEAISFNQKDKLIFEMVLYQYQQKKHPDMLYIDLKQLCQDLGYKTQQRQINYVFDRLKLFSMFRFDIYNIKTKDSIKFDFSDICFNEHKEVYINFNSPKMPLKLLFNAKKAPKKYIIPFKSEYELLLAEFLQLKTKAHSRTTEHPFNYRYRNFKLETLLDYLHLTEKYKSAGEFLYPERQKQIRDKITKALRKLHEYGLKNNISIPRYRYDSKDDMYKIIDFNYPDLRTEKEILIKIEEKIK